MDQSIGWFSPSPSIVWQVSLATGDRRILCIYIPAPCTESFYRLERRMILLQRSRSENRTRITQPELSPFRAPYQRLTNAPALLLVTQLINPPSYEAKEANKIVGWQTPKSGEPLVLPPCYNKHIFALVSLHEQPILQQQQNKTEMITQLRIFRGCWQNWCKKETCVHSFCNFTIDFRLW